MTTTPSTDDRFEERLLRTLLEDHRALTTSAPAGDRGTATTRSVRSAVARRTAPSLALAAVTAATVVGLVVSGSLTGGHDRSRPPVATRHRPVTHPDLRTASFVLGKLAAATAAGPFVVVETGTAPDSQTGQTVHTRSWFVPGGSTSRDEVDDAQGHPLTATVMTSEPDGSTHVVSIDYASRTWSAATYGPAPAGGPGPLPQTPQQNADRLRDDQADGTATLVGPDTIDGQQTLELRQGSVAAGEQLTWVDTQTYLPVREVDTAPGEAITSASTIRTDDEWLPATSANRRLVTAAAAIPPGFTEQR